MNKLLNSSRFNLLPARDLSREMGRWINEMAPVNAGTGRSAPASIWEDDTHYHLEFDLPGVAVEDVDVKISENTLHVTAQRSLTGDIEFLRQERTFGMVERQFSLPSRVDDSAIEAELSNGVLRIDVAKAPESQIKKIEVKTL